MSEKLRSRIARWLSPDLAKTEDRYERLISQMVDEFHWLSGEFPDAADTIRHLLDSHRNYCRAIGEAPYGKLPDDISGFREYLRARRIALQGADHV